jgi:hypothetical protein
MFFGATLELEGDHRGIDVLASANSLAAAGLIPNVAAFDYETSHAPNQALVSVSAIYKGPVHGRGPGGIYQPGEYSLTEDLNARPAYSVWQYYVLAADKTPVVGGIRYLDNPAAIVPAGGTLTWRLVSILAGPNPRSKLVASRQA